MAWPLAAGAQQSAKRWHIGMLETASLAMNAANVTAFRKALRELGYVEGENLVIDYRWSDSASDFPNFAAELVRLNVDLIVLRGALAVLAAKRATATIPIVMVSIADPLTAVASLAHPGGNITGFSALVSEFELR